MKRFFEMEPPERADRNVARAVETALAENRARQRRRWFGRIAIPALATAALALAIRFRPSPEAAPDLDLTGLEDWSEVEPSDLAVIEDLDILEDLDVLDHWEDT